MHTLTQKKLVQEKTHTRSRKHSRKKSGKKTRIILNFNVDHFFDLFLVFFFQPTLSLKDFWLFQVKWKHNK